MTQNSYYCLWVIIIVYFNHSYFKIVILFLQKRLFSFKSLLKKRRKRKKKGIEKINVNQTINSIFSCKYFTNLDCNNGKNVISAEIKFYQIHVFLKFCNVALTLHIDNKGINHERFIRKLHILYVLYFINCY